MSEGDEDEIKQYVDELDKLHKQKLSKQKLSKLEANPDNVSQGLAKLVLTLIELLRRLMEEQALRRMEGGSLTSQEIEKLGLTFMKLEEKMAELKEVFGLEGEELNLDLGPLGNLM